MCLKETLAIMKNTRNYPDIEEYSHHFSYMEMLLSEAMWARSQLSSGHHCVVSQVCLFMKGVILGCPLKFILIKLSSSVSYLYFQSYALHTQGCWKN